ncbi:MAG: DNA polymerase Y family protein [Aquisalimonadaceae bacterium]
MLWLALHFPRLCLDVFGRSRPADTPLAVVEGPLLLAVSPAAATAGARAGMRATQAGALCPTLALINRDTAAEQSALQRLADRALHYSSYVSLHPPNGVILEIGGSLRLFGGIGALLKRIDDDLATLGYETARAVAPTPGAAWLLTLAEDDTPVLDRTRLRRRLADLSCSLLDLDTRQREALAGLGLHTLGDCLALPRADLGRRLGGDLLLQLERALGEQPDPRRAYRAAHVFHAEQPLPGEAHEVESVLFALQRLLQDLAGLLRSLEAGVQQVDIRLHHERRPPTRLSAGLQTPSRAPGRLLAVSRERLQRQPLQAPVIAVGLDAVRFLPLAPEPVMLLDDPGRQHQRYWQHLVERLTARLGENTVHGMETVPEHRPERAWKAAPPDRPGNQQSNSHRPLWLLARPHLLKQHQGRPSWNGPLVLGSTPERIETGWWDGDDISRDYYTARASTGALIWIYRDRRPPRSWYLHGFFG